MNDKQRDESIENLKIADKELGLRLERTITRHDEDIACLDDELQSAKRNYNARLEELEKFWNNHMECNHKIEERLEELERLVSRQGEAHASSGSKGSESDKPQKLLQEYPSGKIIEPQNSSHPMLAKPTLDRNGKQNSSDGFCLDHFADVCPRCLNKGKLAGLNKAASLWNEPDGQRLLSIEISKLEGELA